MRIVELTDRTPERLAGLVEVWERSVRATHLFLSGGEIEAIRAYVPRALEEVPHLIAAEDERGLLAGFMGVGKALLRYGLDRYAVRELAVNEQNPEARGFYEHMGFRVYKRTETDEQGGPYPLLYMKL